MAFQGSLQELSLPDILQLVSVAGKTGYFNLEDEGRSGRIFLSNGAIVDAETARLRGEEALYELISWNDGTFEFHPETVGDRDSIQKSNTSLLMEAARRMDEWQVLHKRIPSTRRVPVFTDQQHEVSISFTPQEWRVIRKIDESRSVEEIADSLGQSPFETCKVLYGLITSGLVRLQENYDDFARKLSRLEAQQLRALSESIHQYAQQLVSAENMQDQLDPAFRLSRAEVEAGRGVTGVLNLIRAHEKVVLETLGPSESKAFADKTKALLV